MTMTRIRVPEIGDPELDIERPVPATRAANARPVPKDLRPEDPLLDAAGRQVRTGLCLQLQRTLGNGELQRRLAGPAREDVAAHHRTARRGITGPAAPLPYLDQIQRSFGRHDVSGVAAHLDMGAAAAAEGLGAEAFTFGEHIAFGSAPSMRTAAHEAAHVVQQRAGLQLEGGAGRAGDRYERHADRVADQVVQGASSEALLDTYAPGLPASVESPVLQRQPSNLRNLLLPVSGQPQGKNYFKELLDLVPYLRSLPRPVQQSFIGLLSQYADLGIEKSVGGVTTSGIPTPVLQTFERYLIEGDTDPKSSLKEDDPTRPTPTRPTPGPNPPSGTTYPIFNIKVPFDENVLLKWLMKRMTF